jgi:anti-sigma factor RsiW
MNAEADTHASNSCCPEEAAAYLDGELSVEASARFEQHARACPTCAEVLNEQKRLLCLLSIAFGEPLVQQPSLPRDFSRVVRARAQSDMGRVRERPERKRALVACVALAALTCMLLGGSALVEALAPVRFGARALVEALDMLGHTLAETGRGANVILHALGAQMPGGAVAFRLFLFVGLSSAIVLLLRLINNYHRTRLPD